MAEYALTLTNPGAESGDLTGWTVSVGSPATAVAGGANDPASVPHSGARFFYGGTVAYSTMYQQIAVPAIAEDGVDLGTATVDLAWYHSTFTGAADDGGVRCGFYDGTEAEISTESALKLTPPEAPTWALATRQAAVPIGTRYIRILVDFDRDEGTYNNYYVDDIAATLVTVATDGYLALIGLPASPSGVGALAVSGYGASVSPIGLPAGAGQQSQGLLALDGVPQDVELLGYVNPAGVPTLTTPLRAPSALATHDFAATLTTAAENRYVCDITGGTADLRVPISSWQATLQLDRKEYLQAIVPAASAYADELTARSAAGGEIVISRVATLPGGGTIEYEMARGPLQVVRLDYGTKRYSATLSGYGDATVPVADPAAYARTIPDRSIRSVSVTGGSVRVRCSIDWLLRPGHQVTATGNTWTVDYISYYVGADPAQAYMDAGTRGTA